MSIETIPSSGPKESRCPVCGGAPIRVHSAREMMFGLRDVFHYGECPSCPLLWLLDPPEDWSRYYPRHYEAYSAPARGRLARIALRLRDGYALSGRGLAGQLLHRVAPNERLDALRSAGLTKNARILDVGAGDGAVVRALRRLGFAQTVGIDPYLEHDVLEDGRVLVHRKQLEEMPGPFDLAMFHHSFEHMADPRGALRTTRRLLRAGGRCVLRIPVFPSWAWERYGVNWVQLDAPRHAVIHSVASLTKLAQETGFSLRGVHYDSGPLQFWGSEQYADDVPLLDPGTGRLTPRGGSLERRRKLELAKRARELNVEGRGDQAAFHLE